MNAFAALFAALDETTKTGAKVEALGRYFATAAPADAAWAVFFLTGRKPRQVVGTRKLREWAAEEAGVPHLAVRRVLRRRGRSVRGDRAAAAAPGENHRPAASPLGRGAAAAASRGRRADAQAGDPGRVAVARRAAKVPLEQADQRVVSGRRLAAAGHKGAGQGQRRRGGDLVASADGGVVADAGVFRPAPRHRRPRRRPLAPLPVLPGAPPGGRSGQPGRPGPVAGRVEVGRHPRAADPPPARRLRLVARRGACHRPLPRACRRGAAFARGYGARTARSSPGRMVPPCPSPSCNGGSAARRWARRF